MYKHPEPLPFEISILSRLLRLNIVKVDLMSLAPVPGKDYYDKSSAIRKFLTSHQIFTILVNKNISVQTDKKIFFISIFGKKLAVHMGLLDEMTLAFIGKNMETQKRKKNNIFVRRKLIFFK